MNKKKNFPRVRVIRVTEREKAFIDVVNFLNCNIMRYNSNYFTDAITGQKIFSISYIEYPEA